MRSANETVQNAVPKRRSERVVLKEDEDVVVVVVVGHVYFWRRVKKRRVSAAVKGTNVYSLSVRLYEAGVRV